MAINKVVFDGDTLIDITGTTATAAQVLQGFGAFGANGEWMDGTAPDGLEYEEGVYSPTSNIARPTIDFAKSHDEPPFLIVMSDISSASELSANSNILFCFFSPYLFNTDNAYPYSTSSERPAVAYYTYYRSQGTTTSAIYVSNSSTTTTSSSSYIGYWTTNTHFRPYSNSTSRYWRSGRSYKWIAIWPKS